MSRAGTRQSAGGAVNTSAGRQALSESLDGFVADLGTKEKPGGRGGKGGGGKGNRANKKPKTAEDEENKRVQKDIKTFF